MNEIKSFLHRLPWIYSAIVVCLLFQTFIPPAWATHFRYGHLTWKPRPDIASHTAEFTFMGGFRRNGYSGTALDGFPQSGDIIHENIGGTSLCFGDGNCTGTLDFQVVSYNVAENWIIGEAILTPHTYPTANSNGSPFLAYSSSCCRIGPGDVEEHINNPFGNYRLETLVDFVTGNTPPRSSGIPIIMCEHDKMCIFNIPAMDEDNDTTRWRLATASEDGGIIQPGQPHAPFSLGINSSTGEVTWDTKDAPFGLYSTQDIIEDRNQVGGIKSKVPIDYFVKVVPQSVDNPPRFDIPPTPIGGIPLIVAVGQPMNFFVQASDPDGDSVITLGSIGLPSGAVFTVPAPANPVVGQFSWTPAASDVGDHSITFNATDNQSHPATPHAISIQVVAESFVNLTINKWGWRFVSPGQPGMTYGIGYRNEGTMDAQNVNIIDTLPPQVVYVSSTGGTYDSDTRQVTFPLGRVSPGGPQYRMIVVNVKSGLPAVPIQNCATITSSSTESTTADNHDCWDTGIQTAHDPNDKAVNPSGNIVAGDVLNYTIQYENIGEGTAFGVYVTDQLDVDLDENTLHINNGGVYDISTRTIRWDIGDLSANTGGSVTFYIKVRNNAPPGSIVSNFATVYFPSVPEETLTNIVVNVIPSPLTLTTTSLPKTKVGLGYSKALEVTGGDPPYTWMVVDGKIPPGLILKSDSGKILGFPKDPGIYNFFVQATDFNGVNSSPQSLQITVGTGDEENKKSNQGTGTRAGWGLGCGTIHGGGGDPPNGAGWISMLILFSPALWTYVRRRWSSCRSR